MKFPVSDVEHLQQIHNLQNKVLTNNMKTLCEVLSPALILPYLAINQLLTVQEQQSITKNPENITDAAKIQALFHLMSGKPEWWDILMKYLADHRFGIRSKLDDELKKLLNQQGN